MRLRRSPHCQQRHESLCVVVTVVVTVVMVVDMAVALVMVVVVSVAGVIGVVRSGMEWHGVGRIYRLEINSPNHLGAQGQPYPY